ncbi:MAG: hypothetical protein HYZ87_03240, partial [Candidatus Omnitrophica bacterium]|nr:hypothetical protein [Candidatus Omnitrophota bacterium]
GLGLGVSSGLGFFSVYFLGRLSFFWMGLFHAVLLALLFFKWRHREKRLFFGTAGERSLFFLVCLAGVLLMVPHFLKSPYGSGLDAWAIWKLKARFLFYGGWDRLFSPTLSFSHLDYPLFYPLSLAWAWLVSGKETTFAAWALCAVFTLSCVGLVMSVFLPKNRSVAAAAALLLISTPAFIGIGSSQYADIFVAYFNLSGVVLICLSLSEAARRASAYAVWGGAFLALGCFVKNEGFLSIAAALFSLGLVVLFDRKLRKKHLGCLKNVLAGSLPALTLTLLFKTKAGFSNEWVNRSNWESFLASGGWLQRLWGVGSAFTGQVFNENSWVYSWFFILAVFILYFRALWRHGRWAVLWVILTAAGYSFVYLISPLELTGHLATSLDRVMLHSFPALVYLSFLAVFEEKKALFSRAPSA